MNFFGPSAGYQQPITNNDFDCIIEPSVGFGGLYLGNYSAATNIEALMRNTLAYCSERHQVHSYLRFRSQL